MSEETEKKPRAIARSKRTRDASHARRVARAVERENDTTGAVADRERKRKIPPRRARRRYRRRATRYYLKLFMFFARARRLGRGVPSVLARSPPARTWT